MVDAHTVEAHSADGPRLGRVPALCEEPAWREVHAQRRNCPLGLRKPAHCARERNHLKIDASNNCLERCGNYRRQMRRRRWQPLWLQAGLHARTRQ